MKNSKIKTDVKRKNFSTLLKQKKNVFIRDRYLYLLLLIPLVYFIVFKYIPMIGLQIAFRDYKIHDGMWGSVWVGTKHFVRLFSSPDFYTTLYNTVVLSFLNIIFGFPMPIILAILLNEVNNMPFKRVTQSLLYMPHFISWIVLGGIITSILSPGTGIINNFIKSLGNEPIYFMGDTGWWRVIYVLSGIWKEAGWGTIVYLAAISGINGELYEAARIDGANKLRQMWHITLPGIRSTIAILLIMRMGQVLQVGFEQIYSLQNDMVLSVSDVISTYEYRIGLLSMQYSYTTALGLFKGVVGLIFVVLTNYIVNKLSDGESVLW